MVDGYIERGALAGLVGGLAYGLFVALVVNPFVAGLEAFEHSHGGEQAVSALATNLLGVGGGVLWGFLFGVAVFGVGYYFLEPALPGGPVAGRLALAAAGFLTVSGAPWLLLPPQPPGVEHSLATGTRTLAYAGMMVAGATVAALSWLAHRKLAGRHDAVRAAGTALPLVLLVAVAALAPTGHVHGDVPAGLAAAFRWTVVFGQVGLWVVLAGVHAWLGDADGPTADTDDFHATAD